MKTHRITLSFLLLSICMVCFISCSKDNEEIIEDDTILEEPIISIDNITHTVQNIATPIQGQPEARYLKYNLLDGVLYFQELTGSPQNGASLWAYTLSGNEFILKEARGTNFSWSGWGTQLFNLGNMFHIDRTSQTRVMYYMPSIDDWVHLLVEVPNSIGYSSDVAAKGQTAYFLGGNFSNEFSSFNYGNNQWYNLAPFPISIYKPLLINHENYIYSISGMLTEGNSSSEDTTFARYSITNNNWEILPELPFREYANIYGKEITIIKNRFLVVSTYASNDTSKLQIYDLQTQKWKEEPLELNFSVTALFQHQDELIIVDQIYNEVTEKYFPRLYKVSLQNMPE
ncbi:MAG: hypothetical protein H0X63_02750 [Flavobacteriales bacterium]|nr:hypothetical protein [Flavobacteriales bacterium]